MDPPALRLRRGLGATTVRTACPRTVIDVNRDPSGASLYPGQTTTGLCPTDDLRRRAALSRRPEARRGGDRRRRGAYFDPYPRGARRRDRRGCRRSTAGSCSTRRTRSAPHAPRLFEGELPHFNIGTNGGRSCDPALSRAVEAACAATRGTAGHRRPLQGRLDDAATTAARRGRARHPDGAGHAAATWPIRTRRRPTRTGRRRYDPEPAAPCATLNDILAACLAFAKGPA